MAYKLVIFDCDGIGNDVFAEILAMYGHQNSRDESTSRFRGMKLARCLDILEREAGIELPESFQTDLGQRMSAAEHFADVDPGGLVMADRVFASMNEIHEFFVSRCL